MLYLVRFASWYDTELPLIAIPYGIAAGVIGVCCWRRSLRATCVLAPLALAASIKFIVPGLIDSDLPSQGTELLIGVTAAIAAATAILRIVDLERSAPALAVTDA